VRESTSREQRLKKQQQQTRDQLKALRQSRVSEQTALLQRLDQQEQLLHVLDAEKRGTPTDPNTPARRTHIRNV